MKTKRKFSLGLALIIIGALLIVTGVVYEAINYPWSTLCGNIPDVSAMKEPKDLAIDHYSYYSNKTTDDVPSSLPAGSQNLPLNRPYIDLTLMGTIKIPRINLSENIVQGVDDEILYAVGHSPHSAEPGKTGNVVLAGHRNYLNMHPFKYLKKMQIGDTIQIEMDENIYSYEVFNVFTVLPEDVWVTQPQPDEEAMLTLITCTPVPSYTQRIIVWARLVDSSNT